MEFTEIVKSIVREQSMIVGEQLARNQAINSGVVEFGTSGIEEIKINTQNPQVTIQKIVDSYEQLFGQASVEVCLNTLRRLPKNELYLILPDSLKTKLA